MAKQRISSGGRSTGTRPLGELGPERGAQGPGGEGRRAPLRSLADHSLPPRTVRYQSVCAFDIFKVFRNTITELINFRYVIMNNYNAWEKLQRQFKTMALRPHDYAEVLLKTLSLNVLSCRSGGNGGREEGRLGTPC